jgi:hypothetical protein
MCAQLARQRAYYGTSVPGEDDQAAEQEPAWLALSPGGIEVAPPDVRRQALPLDRTPVDLHADLKAMGWFRD